MGESSLRCLLISVRLHALCDSCSAFRVRNSAEKNYEFEEKKTAYFGRGGSSPFFFNASAPKNHPDSRNSEERSRPVRPRFACPSRQVISLKCLQFGTFATYGPDRTMSGLR